MYVNREPGKRILFINAHYSTGGAALLTKSIFENTSQEFENTFLYGYDRRGCRTQNQGLYKNVKNISYPASFIINKLSHKLLGADIFTPNMMKLERLIKQADILHIHNIHPHFLNFNNLFNLIIKHRKKVVWTLHDSWAFTGRCALPLNCMNWENECKTCPYLNNYPGSLFDFAYRNMKWKKSIFEKISPEQLIFVSNCDWLAENLQSSFLKKYKINVIYNGIDLEIFKFKERKRIQPLNVIFVSNYVADIVKNPGLFYNIVIRNPHINFTTIGIPPGFKEHNLYHKGYLVSRTAMCQEFQKADFMIFLSMHDSYSTVILESMACGTPVIAFEGKSNKQIIVDSGYVFKDNDVESMISLLQSNDLISTIAEEKALKGRRLVERRNSLDLMVSKYSNLYSEF